MTVEIESVISDKLTGLHCFFSFLEKIDKEKNTNAGTHKITFGVQYIDITVTKTARIIRTEILHAVFMIRSSL